MMPLVLLYFVYSVLAVLLLIFLYHLYKDYEATKKMPSVWCAVKNTGKTVKNLLKWKKETLEDVPTDGVSFQSEAPTDSKFIPAPTTMYTEPTANAPVDLVVSPNDVDEAQPNIEPMKESTDFTDALLEMAIDDSMRAKHEEYLKNADFGSNDALYTVEREPVDIVPWVGLRRVNYGVVPVSKGARTVSSIADISELPKPNKLSEYLNA